ncbi:hypothetical protein QQ020_28645 [Fulvivirgaceae bacterium BMA12]|uniref:DUF5050 domain-containing protein n=1 Tax=Agaribacillus aureus TaxID=3051825 RepID=A0ABT8LEA5_9BACT|nr:hypothetical protein [Fulvivirgaceae bacterium BMA12]
METKNAILLLLGLCFSCNNDDSADPIVEELNEPEHIKTLDFSSSIDYEAVIEDFDVKNGYLYFDYKLRIYKLNLNSESPLAEQILEDTEAPLALAIIGDRLFYQTFWGTSSNVKQVDLNNISNETEVIEIIGSSRFQLTRKNDRLVYLSSPNAISPVNNFYELNPLSSDVLIATDEFVHPKNLKFVDNYLYFSSKNEIRRLDLNNTSAGSSVIYAAPSNGNNTYNDGHIFGFDIEGNIIYYSQISSNNVFSVDLNNPDEEPKVLLTNPDATTGYGELIIDDGKLYVKKYNEKKLEVFKL